MNGGKRRFRWKMSEIRPQRDLYFRFARRMFLAEEPYRSSMWICAKQSIRQLIHFYADMWRFLKALNLEQFWFGVAQWDFDRVQNRY